VLFGDRDAEGHPVRNERQVARREEILTRFLGVVADSTCLRQGARNEIATVLANLPRLQPPQWRST